MLLFQPRSNALQSIVEQFSVYFDKVLNRQYHAADRMKLIGALSSCTRTVRIGKFAVRNDQAKHLDG